MENNTRRIVILNRPESSYIEQAIFILRDVNKVPPQNEIPETDALSEAEKIIDSYIQGVRAPIGDMKKKGHIFRSVLFGVLFLTALAVVTIRLM